MVEKCRKLEPTKKKSTVLSSKYASRSEVLRSKSTKKILPIISKSEEKIFPEKESAISFHIQDIKDPTCYKNECEESKIHENATSRIQEDDFGETDTTGARTLLGDAGLWDPDTVGVLQSELQNELGYRLMLHRLEVRDFRNSQGRDSSDYKE